MNSTAAVNVNGSTLTITGQGPYSVGSDCSGTASVKNQNGTANYYFAVVEDGQLFCSSRATLDTLSAVSLSLHLKPPKTRS
jgi:hypothetical protein